MAELDGLPAGAEFSATKPAVSSLRRGLQRAYVARLAGIALGGGAANPDAQALAEAQLRGIATEIETVRAGDLRLDTTSQAHLAALHARIGKVLDASLELARP